MFGHFDYLINSYRTFNLYEFLHQLDSSDQKPQPFLYTLCHVILIPSSLSRYQTHPRSWTAEVGLRNRIQISNRIIRVFEEFLMDELPKT